MRFVYEPYAVRAISCPVCEGKMDNHLSPHFYDHITKDRKCPISRVTREAGDKMLEVSE